MRQRLSSLSEQSGLGFQAPSVCVLNHLPANILSLFCLSLLPGALTSTRGLTLVTSGFSTENIKVEHLNN